MPERPNGGQLIVAGLCDASLGAAVLGALNGDHVEDRPVLCPFRLATGLPCPFCGLTRSLMAAGGGEWHTSVELSPLGPIVLALAGPVLVSVAVVALRGRRMRLPAPALAALSLVVAASWTLQLSGGIA